MKIRISYKIRDESEKSINLTPEEYFDPLDEDENYEDHGIAKFNHAEEYLEIPAERLEWTEIKITETKIGNRIRTQFSKDGKSWMSHQKDTDGYEEIIVMSRLNDLETNIARIHKDKNENWRINYNGVISDLADGSQTEKMLF
jgi:hypothetical protein